MTRGPRGLGWIAVAAVALGMAFTVANVRGMAGPPEVTPQGPRPYVRLFDQPSDSFERILNQGDGQAFAALAIDPALRRPEIFRGGSPEAAYRAQRPLLGWLVWLSSLGRPESVPLWLVAWSVVGFVALGVAAGWLLMQRGASPLWGLAVILTPGALITLDWTGPEALGVAIAMAGVGWWTRGRLPPAVAALVIAGLARETLLLVPVVLALHEFARGAPRRQTAWLAAPPIVYGLWVVAVHWRLGAWPTDAGRGRLGLPFAGVVDAASSWRTVDVIVALLLVAAVLVALTLDRRDAAARVGLAYLAASTCLGAEVWARFEDFSRVLLPMIAFPLVAVIPHLLSRRSSVASVSAVPGGRS